MIEGVRPYRSALRAELMWTVSALIAVGLVMVYSASAPMAERRFGAATYFLERQFLYVMAGSFLLVFASAFDYRLYAAHRRTLLLLAFGLLLLVLLPGVGSKINGARRWFSIGGMSFQPSEMAKLILVILMADTLSRKGPDRDFLRSVLPRTLLLFSAVALVAVEPDMGTAGLIALVLGSMWLISGAPIRHAVVLALIAAPAAAFALWTKYDHVRQRIETFLDPNADPLGHGYQATQAIIAQGAGGIFGRGLGCAQAKLMFLPEAHNDFILAIVGEEIGLVGSLAVLLLFGLLIFIGIRIARHAPDLNGALLAFGITLSLGLQAMINVAVVTRSMPTKGISLPLISFGGSSLVFAMAGIGVLLNIASVSVLEGTDAPLALGASRLEDESATPIGRMARSSRSGLDGSAVLEGLRGRTAGGRQ